MPFCGCDCADTMVDVNVNAPAEQAPAMAPPTRTDDQILPRSSWVPVGKSNCYLDVEKVTEQSNLQDCCRYSEAHQLLQSLYCFLYNFIDLYSAVLGHCSPLYLPNEEPVLGYLKFSAKRTKWEVFGMPSMNDLITADIRGEQYYNAYLEKVAKHKRYLAGEEVSDPDSPAPKLAKANKPKETKQSKPLASKAAPVTKPAATKTPKPAASQPPKPTPAITELSKKDQSKKRKLVKESFEAPSPTKRPKAGKVIKKQNPKSSLQLVDELVDEGHDESSSLYAELGLTDSETEYEEEMPGTNAGDHDEDQAGPNPCIQAEGQAGSNPGDVAVSQPQSSHVVHARPNHKHMDLEVTDTSIQQNPEQMDEEFTTMAYPNVQENLKLPTEDQVRLEEPASSAGTLSSLQNLDKELSFADQFLVEKSQEDEPEKTNTESEVQLMVMVPIHQDTSSVPLMTTLVIDPTLSQPVSTTRIGKLEQHMADLLQDNLALEERLDKHASRLYKLENLDIPHQVSKSVDEIVTDAVDWAIQAPLRDCFRDLPEANMKQIRHHHMWETKSYEAHEDQKKLYKALEKSMDCNHSEQLLTYLAEAQRKKKRRHDTAAPSSSKTSTSAEYMAWTTTDTRIKPSVSSIPEDLYMDIDSAPNEQVHSSDDEDIGNAHIPKVNLKQDWWKPLSEEDRPATPEPAWSISSSDMHVPMNNWASALASTYAPPPKNSLLAQTGDMAIFMDWFCKKQGITKLTQKDLEGPAFEIVKVFHPNVIHLQYQMEECHKLLIDQVDDAIIRHNVNKPLPLGGPPGQVTIQADFFFNKDLEYLRYGSKGGRPALLISKMKAAYYPDVGLEQMVPDQMWIEEECKYDIAAMYGISHWLFQRQMILTLTTPY
ncbi:hypothetical protein Tco_0132845 [Tanacetum coccineum]